MGCDTPQALPSVYRGQKIVIAGNEKQLPPLTLFRTTDGQEEDNVAVSRAIKKIIVVSSIPPSDLDVTQSQFDGPKLFKRYLEYAYAVSNNDVDRVKGILSELSTDTKIRRGSGVLTFESPFEEEVYEELTKRGFVVHSQVGQSGFRVDLAVVNPEDPSSYLLGIECDGAKYHSSMTARERDVFRQKFLERRGWNIARVWSTKWWHNREREVHRLLGRIKQLR